MKMIDTLKNNILISLDFLGSLLGLSSESSLDVRWFLVEVVLKLLLLHNFEK